MLHLPLAGILPARRRPHGSGGAGYNVVLQDEDLLAYIDRFQFFLLSLHRVYPNRNIIRMKLYFKYFLCAAAVLIVAAACSKASHEPNPSEGNPPANDVHPSIVVRGGTFDKEANDPLRGIMVVLLAYYDGEYVRKDTTYTSSEGLFEIAAPLREEVIDYTLLAKDKDGEENGGDFETSYINITLSQNSPSFDEVSRGYLLEGNIFYLEKKAN